MKKTKLTACGIQNNDDVVVGWVIVCLCMLELNEKLNNILWENVIYHTCELEFSIFF